MTRTLAPSVINAGASREGFTNLAGPRFSQDRVKSIDTVGHHLAVPCEQAFTRSVIPAVLGVAVIRPISVPCDCSWMLLIPWITCFADANASVDGIIQEFVEMHGGADPGVAIGVTVDPVQRS